MASETQVQKRILACESNYPFNLTGTITDMRRIFSVEIDLDYDAMCISWKWKRQEKQLYGFFKRQTGKIAHVIMSTWIRKENLKGNFYLIATQQRTKHVKAKVDKTQQNSKCRLWGDRDETINHITTENYALCNRYVKAEIDDTEQNSKCRLCGCWDETFNLIISECSKLAQRKYKTRRCWVGKVIHRNCAKELNLTIRPNTICTNQNLS